MRILHICKDEKFINSANTIFEKVKEGNNLFLIIIKKDKTSLHHVTQKDNVKVIQENQIKTMSKIVSEFDIVFFHSYVSEFNQIFKYIKPHQKIIWFCFGMEVYNDPYLYPREQLLDEITRSLNPQKKQIFKKRIKNKLRPWYRMLNPGLPFNKYENKKRRLKQKRTNLNRIDFIANVYLEEHKKINQLTGLKKPWFHYWYFPLSYMVDIESTNIVIEKNKIFIGNSGYLTNNHLDVFYKLKELNLSNRKVITPLGYGKESYIKQVIRTGNELFKVDFEPILDFLPLEQYNEYLETSKTAIFYARRQQGTGTIIPLLWHGAKVFLSDKSTFYHFLKRIGVHIYCYETELNENSINAGLSVKEIEHNRTVLYKHLNEEYLLEQLKKQLDPILES